MSTLPREFSTSGRQNAASKKGVENKTKAKMIADQMAADKRGKVPARPETIKFSSKKLR